MKCIYAYYLNSWKFNISKYGKMMVFTHQIFGLGGDSAIRKLVVIGICYD